MEYWTGRHYEHQAEVLAIRRLLRGRHFAMAVDVGGGFGRLSILLEEFADRVTIVDPSRQQLDVAEVFLRGHPRIDLELMRADELMFEDSSVDLLTMIRVLHHIPDPRAEMSEIARVLAPEGYAIIEVANSLHILNRMKHAVNGEDVPPGPIDIRSKRFPNDGGIPFVNHNPYTITEQLTDCGLKVARLLSVSNLRNSWLKKVMPAHLMLTVESMLQPALARSLFGPSLFFLLHKA
jgi:ubiquinone/menaquinone biosynthesis C-methylase UbiE